MYDAEMTRTRAVTSSRYKIMVNRSSEDATFVIIDSPHRCIIEDGFSTLIAAVNRVEFLDSSIPKEA